MPNPLTLKGTFTFGVPSPDKLKPLPEGWKYVMHSRRFLMAKGPDARAWYVTTKGLVLCRKANARDAEETHGYLSVGERYPDYNHVMKLWPEP